MVDFDFGVEFGFLEDKVVEHSIQAGIEKGMVVVVVKHKRKTFRTCKNEDNKLKLVKSKKRQV